MSVTIRPYRRGGWEVDIRVVTPDGARHARERKRAPMSSRSAAQRWAESCDLDEAAIRQVLYELPQGKGARRRAISPCPLSGRELDVLRRLAEGKVYKQIAAELDLSASTVRSHLHNVYGKLGALDRAQAVLMATEQGWI